MKKIRLTKEEREIEDSIGEYVPVSKEEDARIRRALEATRARLRLKKDGVLHIRISSQDLAQIKAKAQRMGIPYQTYISDCLHQLALPAR